MTRPPALRSIRAAITTLTRVPAGGFPFTTDEWAWAPAYFPLVGLAIGVVQGFLVRLFLPAGDLGAATLSMGATLLLTGAFHEDGLADTADALGGATDRDKVLLILKDSRIGSFGAAALTISVLARAAFLARLGRDALWAAPLAGCIARVGPVWLLARMPYVSADATARNRHFTPSGDPQAAVGTCWAIFAFLLVGGIGWASTLRLVTCALAVAAACLICAWRFHRRAGGITGDLLGAAEQVSEVVAFTVLAWGIG